MCPFFSFASSVYSVNKFRNKYIQQCQSCAIVIVLGTDYDLGLIFH